MSKSAMRHHMMARKNPLSVNGQVVPAGLQYAGGHDMGALHMSGMHHMAGLEGMVGKGMDMVKTPLGIALAVGLSIYLLTKDDKKKANPRRRRRNGTKKGMARKTARKAYSKNPRRRKNASAHQKRAKKAMNLYHSGEASSLKAAWRMV